MNYRNAEASILDHPNQLQQGGSADEGLNKRGNHSARVAFLEEMLEGGIPPLQQRSDGQDIKRKSDVLQRVSESRDKFVTATPYADANVFNRITKACFA